MKKREKNKRETEPKKDFRYYLKLIVLIGFVLGGFTLLLLPVDYFDQGESICVSKMVFDLECYACGMTRGIMHLIHFDFSGAWHYNKMAFIVFPLVVYLVIKEFINLYAIHKKVSS